MANISGNKRRSLGKILFFIGMAGILISLALVFIGIFLANDINSLTCEWLALATLISIPVSFIIAVAGAISWYIEPFVDRIRASKSNAHDSQSESK